MNFAHQELTGKIISAAIAVHESLRPGLDEKLYERALCIELAERNIHFTQQPKYDVNYHGKFLGHLIPDLVVENSLIVETKCVDNFHDIHVAQVIGYLNITSLDVGLLLNFKSWPLGKRRVIRPGYQNSTLCPP
ncbi:MAG: GxxExxY protein [Verrucomicrobiota bacterium]